MSETAAVDAAAAAPAAAPSAAASFELLQHQRSFFAAVSRGNIAKVREMIFGAVSDDGKTTKPPLIHSIDFVVAESGPGGVSAAMAGAAAKRASGGGGSGSVTAALTAAGATVAGGGAATKPPAAATSTTSTAAVPTTAAAAAAAAPAVTAASKKPASTKLPPIEITNLITPAAATKPAAAAPLFVSRAETGAAAKATKSSKVDHSHEIDILSTLTLKQPNSSATSNNQTAAAAAAAQALSPLALAVLDADTAIIELLLSAKSSAAGGAGVSSPPLPFSVDVNLTCRGGRTALMDCVAGRASDSFDVKRQVKRAEIAKLLIASGARVDPSEIKSGFTALHLAAAHTRPLVVPILLSAGADPHVRDRYDRTVIDIATQSPVSVRDEYEKQFIAALTKEISAVQLRIGRKLSELINGASSDVTLLIVHYVL